MTVDTEIFRSTYSPSEFESGKDSHLVTAQKDRQLVTVSQEDTGTLWLPSSLSRLVQSASTISACIQRVQAKGVLRE